MQAINIALGGTLIQHIPDLNMDINHKDLSTKHITKLKQLNWERKFKDHILNGTPKNIFPQSHKIKVKDGTKLAEIYQSVNANINLDEINELSIHHQGCLPENLAPGLKISAVAEDGIVEAAELKNHVFCLLIQFHLECNVSKIAKPAIDKLIASISNK
jgi:gamma-glutamyl-gamma-aminobutyrate hydrolase PuuD